MMRLHQKIILDRLVGKPLAFLLNLIVWPLSKVIRINHDDSSAKVKTIVVAKLLGMGSILRATPMVRALKAKYPHAKYIFISTLKNKSLIESLPLIDKAYYIRDTSIFLMAADTLGLLIHLWKERVDLYFDLEVYSALSTILATLSLSRNRYGFYRSSTAFRRGLNTHLVYFNDAQPISKVYLQLARACGIKQMDYRIEKIRLGPQVREEVKSWMKKKSVSEEESYLVINPNASDLLLERRWPADYFALLINALAKDWRKPMFIVGSLAERDYVEGMLVKLKGPAASLVRNTCGEFSLQGTMGLIEKASLMITNDSGLYHIATSFGVPVISLWGPVSPHHYADIRNSDDFIFYSQDIYCSPCVHRTHFPPCKGNNVCMKSIAPERVYKKACEILGLPASPDLVDMREIYENEGLSDLDIIIRGRPR